MPIMKTKYECSLFGYTDCVKWQRVCVYHLLSTADSNAIITTQAILIYRIINVCLLRYWAQVKGLFFKYMTCTLYIIYMIESVLNHHEYFGT